MPEFGFNGGAYTSRSVAVNAQDCVNLYPEGDPTGKSRLPLYGTPGLKVFATLAHSPIRTLWAGEERLFTVAGSKLYELDSAGNPTNGLGGNDFRGDVGTDASDTTAQIFPNGLGTQIMIISADKAYVDNGSSVALAQFTGGGGDVNARTGCFLDGYGIVADSFSKQFFRSAINDYTTWNPLDVQSQEAYPDNIYSMIADHRELWVAGDQTIEAYRNEGDADNPFRTDPSAFIETGIQATWTFTKLPGIGPAWLGGDSRGRPIAYRVNGFDGERISTAAVEEAWAGYSDITDAIAWAESWPGHTWWVITFPTGDATWVYDVELDLWHRRGYSASLNRSRARNHAYVFGKHLVGDHTNGIIYELDMDTYLDNATSITRLRSSPYVANERNTIFHGRFELDYEAGLIDTPDFTLEWSNDGGKNWITPLTSSGGAAGNNEPQVYWNRLGSTKSGRIFRVKSTEAMRHAWVNADLKASVGVD